MNPGIIIQARLNSSRLPNKVLKEINGKKLIDIVYDECTKTKLFVVIAIPEKDGTGFENQLQRGTTVFEGSENDLIDRFYHCAKALKFDPIIRVCADAKTIHSELILQQLENYKKYNHICHGNYCEVFSFKQLEDYYLHDKRPITREHVTMGMIQDMSVDYEIDLK